MTYRIDCIGNLNTKGISSFQRNGLFSVGVSVNVECPKINRPYQLMTSLSLVADVMQGFMGFT